MAILSDRERQALIAFRDYPTIEHVAEALGVKVSTARCHLHNAKKKIAKLSKGLVGNNCKNLNKTLMPGLSVRTSSDNSDNMNITLIKTIDASDDRKTELEQLQEDIKYGLSRMTYKRYGLGLEPRNRDERIAYGVNGVGEWDYIRKQNVACLKELSLSGRKRIVSVRGTEHTSRVRKIIRERGIKKLSTSYSDTLEDIESNVYRYLCRDDGDVAAIIQASTTVYTNYDFKKKKVTVEFNNERKFGSINLYDSKRKKLYSLLKTNQYKTGREYQSEANIDHIRKEVNYIGINISGVEVKFHCKLQ